MRPDRNPVTIDEYWAALFRYATGWLGWTPEIALNTPVPQLVLALEGRAECLIRTSPFGAGGGKQKTGRLDRAGRRDVAGRLRGFFADRIRRKS